MEPELSNEDLILKKYPFLKQFIIGDLGALTVQRMDASLLEQIPYTRRAWGHGEDSRDYHLLGGGGKIITTVTPKDRKRDGELSIRSPLTWLGIFFTKGETVREAVKRVADSNTDQIAYVVEVHHRPRNMTSWGEVIPAESFLVLYKVPKKYNLAELM